jgi:hypothetical protein
MEYGHNRWNQHWRQGQYQYQDWKEHRFTCIFFRAADRCISFSEGRATLRDSRPIATARVCGATK